MEIEEQGNNRFTHVSGIQSIKTKIIVFALVAAIIPSMTLGILSYIQNRTLLQQKIDNELRHATVRTADEIDLWLKKRLYDLKVFASSYVVSENLQRMLGKDRNEIEGLVATSRVKTYLQSIRDKFSDYEELVVISMIGEPLVTSNQRPPFISLPDHWFENLQDGSPIVSAPYWDPNLQPRVITLAEVIKSADNRPLGLMTAKIGLRAIWAVLKRQTTEGINDIYLIDDKGRFLFSGASMSDGKMPSGTVANRPGVLALTDMPIEYTNFRGLPVVGLAVDIPTTGWCVVTETSKDSAYAGMVRLGRITVGLVAALLLAMSILAYYLGRTIVRPLKTLGQEARRIAAGDLDVRIPVHGNNEVSYLTQVFNHMVASLRQGQADISLAHEALIEKNRELHELSITDSLTGLFNRKQLMDLFDLELSRTLRYGTHFSVLIADIDHFKRINDTYGHLAGDAVLRRVADTLRQTVRECDHVGRYGGEEFLVILPNTESDKAMDVARRIRYEISQIRFHNDGNELSLTISVGLSQCTDADDSAETVLSRADAALYQAKEGGRNRVIGP